MNRFFLTLTIVALVAPFASAQNNSITGTVQDARGTGLHHVFVGDPQNKIGAFTDSLGNFTIKAIPGSKLQFDLQGYKDTTVAIDKGNESPQVLLKGTGSAIKSINARSSFQADSSLQRPDNIYLDRMPGHEKGKTKGNRYLLDIFAHGFFVNASDQLIYNRDYLYDYDKIGGGLLITKDGKSIMEMSFDQTKSFTLYSNRDEVFVFEKVPTIDVSHYLQVLSAGKKYKIYKLTKTTLRKADYVNSGMVQHGNDYDEFLDDADYYLLEVQSNQAKKFSLKKKGIKEAFAQDADKVNKFMSANSGDINDAYLASLGDALNQ